MATAAGWPDFIDHCPNAPVEPGAGTQYDVRQMTSEERQHEHHPHP